MKNQVVDGIRVRVVRADGTTLYNLLVDQGGDLIPFFNGWRRVRRREMIRAGNEVLEGWLSDEEFQKQKSRSRDPRVDNANVICHNEITHEGAHNEHHERTQTIR